MELLYHLRLLHRLLVSFLLLLKRHLALQLFARGFVEALELLELLVLRHLGSFVNAQVLAHELFRSDVEDAELDDAVEVHELGDGAPRCHVAVLEVEGVMVPVDQLRACKSTRVSEEMFI